jgi:hypothetical protein
VEYWEDYFGRFYCSQTSGVNKKEVILAELIQNKNKPIEEANALIA